MKGTYEESVFINCSFDSDFNPLLNSIVFTLLSCGFVPRSAMEEDDSSDSRLDKIIRLIKSCKYGVHDISRTQSDKITNLPRFNMPFELGIFWGLKKGGNKVQKKKVALIFECEKYAYQKYLSDINGVDIKAHNNSVEAVIKHIRNWFCTNAENKIIPPASKIIQNYYEFSIKRLPLILEAAHFKPNEVMFNDYCRFIDLALNKT